MYSVYKSVVLGHKVCKISDTRAIVVSVKGTSLSGSLVGSETPFSEEFYRPYIHDSTLKEEEGKFRVVRHYRPDMFNWEPRMEMGQQIGVKARGGVTFVFEVDERAYWKIGKAGRGGKVYDVYVAVCSEGDNYNKKMGVEVAMSRPKLFTAYISEGQCLLSSAIYLLLGNTFRKPFSYDDVREEAKRCIDQLNKEADKGSRLNRCIDVVMEIN